MPTPGGHRRYPIGEIERLRRELSIVDVGSDVTPPPAAPLPAVATVLFEHGPRLITDATRRSAVSLAAYSGARGQRCLDAFVAGFRRGEYEPACTVYLDTVRQALLDGASFIQCMRLFYYFARGVQQELIARGVADTEAAGWTVFYEHITESALAWLTTAPTGAASEHGNWSAAWPLIDHVHLPCAVVEHDGRIIAANLALATLLDREPAAMAGSHAVDAVPARHRPYFDRLMNAAGPGGLADHVGDVLRVTLVRGDGEEVSADVVFDPADDAEPGGPLLVMVIDRRVEVERTAQLARFETLLAKAPVASYLVTADLTVCSWNEAAQEMLGYEPDEVIGRSVRQLVPDDQESILTAQRALVMSGQDVRGVEGSRRAKDGILVDVLIDLVLVQPDNHGAPHVGVFLRPR